ncbi:hypothetical protein [Microbulbifer magnicolonia]|uniref:hypothetical protein n=1 Tax=Microbulbifer magnicolonia TaxID=3109744 RepID=UPI002B40F07A|nr:hypothetical protein [Microbulbifer sp. GG15]
MPNTFAYAMLLCWPLVAVLIFYYRRLSTLSAAFWVIVGGYLLLPAAMEIDLPMLPPLDQTSIPALSALLGCVFIRKVRIKLLPDSGLQRWLFLGLLIAPLLSTITNPEPFFDGRQTKRGLEMYDALAGILQMYLTLLPMLIGLSLVKSPADIVRLLKLLLYAAIAYSPLILFEVRMSPQLHTWVYGFFPHDFSQQMRFDGFRPVVFLGHGLLVAMFASVSLCAATTLYKQKYTLGSLPVGMFVLYYAIVLLLCKSVGAWLLGFGSMLCVLMLSPRLLLSVATFIALLAFVYPLMAMNGLIPEKMLVETAALFGQDRAQSLAYRFSHEERLLDHAARKLSFGWGSWGRNQFYNSVSDGHWVKIIGCFGMLGYLTKAGLLLTSITRGYGVLKTISNRGERGAYAGLLLICALFMVDQVPNSSLSPYFWLLAGGALGIPRRRLAVPLPRRQRLQQSSAYPRMARSPR